MAPVLQGKFSELQPIFKQSCNFSSCHMTASTGSGNMGLADSGAYCALVGATQGATFRQTAQALFPKRVATGNHAMSYLYKKLTLATTEAGLTTALGQRMPDTGMTLEPYQIDGFAKWIDNGATDDTMTSGACK